MADIHGGAFSDKVHAELHSMPRNMGVHQLTVSADCFEKRVPIPMIRTVNDEDPVGDLSGPSGPTQAQCPGHRSAAIARDGPPRRNTLFPGGDGAPESGGVR